MAGNFCSSVISFKTFTVAHDGPKDYACESVMEIISHET